MVDDHPYNKIMDYNLQCTPPEFQEAEGRVDLVPTKSRDTYILAYKRFLKWCEEKSMTNFSENVLLAYFSHLDTALNMQSSTLWSQYSMVKSMLNIKHGQDISRYLKLRAYLKQKNKGHRPKKSKVFTKEEFEKFLFEADDEKYLAYKVVLLIGISGGCRCEEMVKMKTSDIEDLNTYLRIKIAESKSNKVRSFTIVGDQFINIFKKYASSRPKDMKNQRFFLKYAKGKCTKSPMGIHKFGSIPREVASYLKLPNCKDYTGHCLRRTSFALLIDGGANITTSKQHGGWPLSTVAVGNENRQKHLGFTGSNNFANLSRDADSSIKLGNALVENQINSEGDGEMSNESDNLTSELRRRNRADCAFQRAIENQTETTEEPYLLYEDAFYSTTTTHCSQESEVKVKCEDEIDVEDMSYVFVPSPSASASSSNLYSTLNADSSKRMGDMDNEYLIDKKPCISENASVDNALTSFFLSMAKTVERFPLIDQVQIKSTVFEIVNSTEMRLARCGSIDQTMK